MSAWIEMKRHFEARALEWFNGLYLWSWGTYVTVHPGMFIANGKFGLTDIMPQEDWGLMAFGGGMTRLMALIVNGRWGLTPIIRVAMSFLSMFCWFWIWIGILKTGTSPGVVMFPGLMLADAFSMYRAASDAFEAEATRRLKALQDQDLSNVRTLASRG